MKKIISLILVTATMLALLTSCASKVKIKDGAELALDRVKQAAKNVGVRLENAAPGADRKDEFFDALEDEAVEIKEAAKQKADDLQKKLEALMRGDKEA